MTPSRPLRWTAQPTFFFECPECGLTILEGNPRRCPHQEGRGVWFTAGRDRLSNVEELLARCGLEKGAPTPKPREQAAMSDDDLIGAQCPKGT